ncbi:PspC domain-containing protein [Sphingosinicella sp. LHD-64]|uniref:PspC domain-containing protein n=1 Tax=Sphingosinicella sp. LHD-64 TaxID=3072139 RepID=UPI0028105B65|nr:PspC domain-containing protein [Sphingosinicella sp. LHD-64]MDQ8755511.1 PspC domain-containing protein [Sphingosinicella sp. LHD-64]
MMQTQGNLFTRDDTFFGVCQGLGEDLGFNPNWLRVALPVLAFFNPVAAIGAYAAGGVLVLATRLLVPNPRLPVTEVPTEVEAASPVEAQPATEREPMPLAA